MKKLLSLILIMTIWGMAQAQHTTPRFGTGSNNNGQSLTYSYLAVTDVLHNDTVILKPGSWKTIVNQSVTDSTCYKIGSVKGSYLGDQIVFHFNNSSGAHKIIFITSSWSFGSATNVMTLTSSKHADIVFEFNGATWIEVSRLIGT